MTPSDAIYNDHKQEFEPETAANHLDKLNRFLTMLCRALCALADMYTACSVTGASFGLLTIPSSSSRRSCGCM
jgi:hypothetical protein